MARLPGRPKMMHFESSRSVQDRLNLKRPDTWGGLADRGMNGRLCWSMLGWPAPAQTSFTTQGCGEELCTDTVSTRSFRSEIFLATAEAQRRKAISPCRILYKHRTRTVQGGKITCSCLYRACTANFFTSSVFFFTTALQFPVSQMKSKSKLSQPTLGHVSAGYSTESKSS